MRGRLLGRPGGKEATVFWRPCFYFGSFGKCLLRQHGPGTDEFTTARPQSGDKAVPLSSAVMGQSQPGRSLGHPGLCSPCLRRRSAHTEMASPMLGTLNSEMTCWRQGCVRLFTDRVREASPDSVAGALGTLPGTGCCRQMATAPDILGSVGLSGGMGVLACLDTRGWCAGSVVRRGRSQQSPKDDALSRESWRIRLEMEAWSQKLGP